MLNPTLFQFLNGNWGPHTFDCFANDQNKQTLWFHSWYWSPGAEAVDTFTVNWGNEICWLLSPVYLVGHALGHARACRAQGTLVVPLWRSAPFGHSFALMVGILLPSFMLIMNSPMRRGRSYQDIVVIMLVTHMLQILACWLFTLTLRDLQSCLIQDSMFKTQLEYA